MIYAYSTILNEINVLEHEIEKVQNELIRFPGDNCLQEIYTRTEENLDDLKSAAKILEKHTFVE